MSEPTDMDEVLKLLMSIHGVGEALAKKMYDAGIRTLEDVANAPGVAKHIQLSAKYHKDINTTSTTEEVSKFLQEVRKTIRHKLIRSIDINGSFARGSDSHYDMDMLIYLSDTLPIGDIVVLFREQKYFVDILTEGDFKCDMLVRMPSKRVSILEIYTCTEIDRGAMMLYTTGPVEFTVVMRIKAQKMGYKLNQHGLYDGTGKLVASRTEKEVFNAMGMPFIPIRERGTHRIFEKYFKGM